MKKSVLTGWVALAMALTWASTTNASGSAGLDRTQQLPGRLADPYYERGKSVYLGRKKGIEKYAYCVSVDGEPVKIKRKSMKPFKGTTYTELANKLFNCDEPEQLISQQLPSEELVYVLYYLDVRYKLSLTRS